MRVIIWSPKAQKDYAKIIDYLLTEWTLKEVQKFIEQIEDIISILEKGNIDFKAIRYKSLHLVVISNQISIFYRIHSKAKIEIIHLWDNRQNPSKLYK
jgi:plasmid stabilization system protein ParE